MDKRICLVYNPNSGNKRFKARLHDCVVVFQKAGYLTDVFCTLTFGDIEQLIAGFSPGQYDVIAVSGGDGTINLVVNALFAHGHDIPLLLLPSGTANDFASSLKIPKKTKDAAALINGTAVECDVGIANGRYFLNVFAAGHMADISQVVGKELKNSLGKLAYYIAGISKLTSVSPFPVRITNAAGSVEESILLMLVLNSRGLGGMYNIAPTASVDDGLLDFIAVKEMPLLDIAALALKMMAGDHLNEPSVIHFKDSCIKIESLAESSVPTDLDGEQGPSFPIIIESKHRALRVFANTP